MQIEEIQQKKRELEKSIADLLTEFMKATKTDITNLSYTEGTIGFGQKAIIDVNVTVEI